MLQKLLLLVGLCSLLHVQRAAAQSKESLKARMAANICDCLTQKAAIKNPSELSKDQIKQVFGECFGSEAGKEMKAIKLAYGPDAFGNSVLMRTMGEEVGALLLQNCPKSMGFFMAMSSNGATDSGSATTATTTGQTVGRLGGLSGPGMVLLEMQVSKTEKTYFAWIRHFEQADELLAKLPSLQDRQARVSWQEVEVLQPDTRHYQKVREITAIELLQ